MRDSIVSNEIVLLERVCGKEIHERPGALEGDAEDSRGPRASGDRREGVPRQRYPGVRASVKTKHAEFVSTKIGIKNPESLSRFL
mgnify:CR=1 FL=1